VFQNVKKKWIAAREEKLEAEFSDRLASLQRKYEEQESFVISEINEREESLQRKQRDLEDIIRRTNDKKLELEKKNEELMVQIRLIEAKASPDHVWASAFQAGFSKCWDMMWEFQSEQVTKLREKIRNQAINETLGRLNGNKLP